MIRSLKKGVTSQSSPHLNRASDARGKGQDDNLLRSGVSHAERRRDAQRSTLDLLSQRSDGEGETVTNIEQMQTAALRTNIEARRVPPASPRVKSLALNIKSIKSYETLYDVDAKVAEQHADATLSVGNLLSARFGQEGLIPPGASLASLTVESRRPDSEEARVSMPARAIPQVGMSVEELSQVLNLVPNKLAQPTVPMVLLEMRELPDIAGGHSPGAISVSTPLDFDSMQDAIVRDHVRDVAPYLRAQAITSKSASMGHLNPDIKTEQDGASETSSMEVTDMLNGVLPEDARSFVESTPVSRRGSEEASKDRSPSPPSPVKQNGPPRSKPSLNKLAERNHYQLPTIYSARSQSQVDGHGLSFQTPDGIAEEVPATTMLTSSVISMVSRLSPVLSKPQGLESQETVPKPASAIVSSTSVNAPATIPPKVPVIKPVQEPVQTVSVTAAKEEADESTLRPVSFFQTLKQQLHEYIPISGNSAFARGYDTVVNLINMWNMIALPLALAFATDITSWPWLLSQYLVDSCLWGHVILSSVRSYNDDYGIEIRDLRMIWNRYFFRLQGYNDLVAIIPLDLIPVLLSLGSDDGVDMRIWAGLRMLRLYRVSRLISQFYDWSIPGISISLARITKSLMVVMIFAHVSACMFWFLNGLEGPYPTTWNVRQSLVQPFVLPDYKFHLYSWADGPDTRFMRSDGESVTVFTQYLASLVAAQRSIVFTFRSTNTVAEQLYTCIEMLINAFIYGSIFGNIESYIRSIDARERSDEHERDHLIKSNYMTKYMRSKRFPPELQKKILSHTSMVWQRLKGMDESKLFSDLPNLLRQEIANTLYLSLVNAVPLFKDLDSSFRQSLVINLKPLHVMPGWLVFQKGDEGQEMYFVRAGKVEICSGDLSIVFSTLETGSFFGEIALLEDTRRTASVRAATETELCVLHKDNFTRILTAFPKASALIQKSIMERKEADRKRKEEAERLKVLEEAETLRKLEEEVSAKLAKRRRRSSVFGGMRRTR